MCDTGKDKIVEYVTQECEKYDISKMEMMCVVLTTIGCEMVEVSERTAS